MRAMGHWMLRSTADLIPLGGYEHETATPRVKRESGETAKTQIHVNYSNFPNVLGVLLCTIG